jgi:4'-phosphopantetheinyl transferase
MHEVLLHIAHGGAALARLAAHAGVLDAGEQASAARFRFAADRELYQAAHVLLRRALSAQVPVDPAQWRFIRGAHGRPEIDPIACPEARGLRFNLSHTRGLVCCALTRGLPVGVDAECPRPMQDARAIAERFFAAEEAAAVAAAGAPGSAAEATTFRNLWTLKEAYVKALGLGLSMGLADFAFRLTDSAPAAIALHGPTGADHPAAHWRCLLLHLEPGGWTLAAAVPAATGARFQALLHTPDGADSTGTVLAGFTAATELAGVRAVPMVAAHR